MLPSPARRMASSAGAFSSCSTRRNYLMDHRSDALIAFITELLGHSFVLDAMQTTAADTWAHVEELIEEHRQREGAAHAADRLLVSRLSQAVPSVSSFLTPLPLRAAWMAYDAKYRVSRRRVVPPGFDDIRHVLNLAQVMALQHTDLRLVTFDGDCTLYKDGRDFSDEKLARYISLLLQRGVAVALVTAAGYQYDAVRYMGRLCGLLSYFQQCDLPADAAARFWVLGGESNYLLSCEAAQGEKGEAVYVLRPRPELWDLLWSPDEAPSRFAPTFTNLRLRITHSSPHNGRPAPPPQHPTPAATLTSRPPMHITPFHNWWHTHPHPTQ